MWKLLKENTIFPPPLDGKFLQEFYCFKVIYRLGNKFHFIWEIQLLLYNFNTDPFFVCITWGSERKDIGSAYL